MWSDKTPPLLSLGLLISHQTQACLPQGLGLTSPSSGSPLGRNCTSFKPSLKCPLLKEASCPPCPALRHSFCFFRSHTLTHFPHTIKFTFHFVHCLFICLLLQDCMLLEDSNGLATSGSQCTRPGTQQMPSCICRINENLFCSLTTRLGGNTILEMYIYICLYIYIHIHMYICCCCSVATSYPALCDPMNCSTPGSSVVVYTYIYFPFFRCIPWTLLTLSKASTVPTRLR